MRFISCQTVSSVNMWWSGFIRTSNVRPFSDNSTMLASGHDLFTANLKKWLSAVFIKAGCSECLSSIGWRRPKVGFCSLSYCCTNWQNQDAPSTNLEGKTITVQMNFSHLLKQSGRSENTNCGPFEADQKNSDDRSTVNLKPEWKCIRNSFGFFFVFCFFSITSITNGGSWWCHS